MAALVGRWCVFLYNQHPAADSTRRPTLLAILARASSGLLRRGDKATAARTAKRPWQVFVIQVNVPVESVIAASGSFQKEGASCRSYVGSSYACLDNLPNYVSPPI